MELSEQEMIKELPAFVTDPANQVKVQALIAGERPSLPGSSRKIEASL